MDNDTSLQASFWSIVILQTMGSVDMPGRGPRKMPAPRAYLAAIIAWAALNLLADTGRERAASIVGWVLVLTSLVVGPMGAIGENGKRLINFLNSASSEVSSQGQVTP